MKTFLRLAVTEDTASSQQIVAVPRAKTKSLRSQKVGSFLAVTDDFLLRNAGAKRVH